MKKVFCLIFIASYAIAGMFLVIELLDYFDLSISPPVEMIAYTVWIVVCFSAYRWMPGFYLSTMRVRKTILEEEEWIHPLMHELNLRTGIDPAPELFVLEKPEMDAFATGHKTIILSRGLLVSLSELEIKAVMAHEYGHLKSKDTMTSSAFAMATKPPLFLYNLVRLIFGWVKNWFSKEKGFLKKLLLVVLIVILSYWYTELVILFLILFIFMKVFPFFNLLVRAAWCYFTRGYEFKQDGFAQSLGCGKHLKSALLKIDSLNSNTLVNRITQFWITHPMTYMRIRRLEWLDGYRATP